MDDSYNSDGMSNDENLIVSLNDTYKLIQDSVTRKLKEVACLKEITKNQLVNITELQKKCEASSITINQLPLSKLVAAKRFEEVMKGIIHLQNKQFEVNELLNLSMKEFDEILLLVNNSKQEFSLEKHLASQRNLIYKKDSEEIKCISERNIVNIKKIIATKLSFLERLKPIIKEQQKDLETVVNYYNNINGQANYKESLITGIKQQISDVESKLRDIFGKTEQFNTDTNEKLCYMATELETLIEKFDIGRKCLLDVQNEIEAISLSCNEIENICTFLNDELFHETETFTRTEIELKGKTDDIQNAKCNLEFLLKRVSQLKVDVNEIYETQLLFDSKEKHVCELNRELEELLNKKLVLDAGLLEVGKRSKEIQKSIADGCSKLGKLQNIHAETQIKIDLLKSSYNNLQLVIKDKKDNTCNEIKQLKTTISLLDNSINKKSNLLENCNLTWKSLNEDYEQKKDLIDEKINFKEKIDSVTEKYNGISDQLLSMKEEIEKKQILKKNIDSISENIKLQKDKYVETMESLYKKKQELTKFHYENIEEFLKQQNEVQLERQNDLERVEDCANRAEFTHFKAKCQVQLLKGELNCIKENLKTYNCENEMLKMFLMWLQSNSNPSQKQKKAPISNAPYLNDDEVEIYDLSLHQICASKSSGKEAENIYEDPSLISNESVLKKKRESKGQTRKTLLTVTAPIPVNQKSSSLPKKKKNEAMDEKTILDTILDSSQTD